MHAWGIPTKWWSTIHWGISPTWRDQNWTISIFWQICWCTTETTLCPNGSVSLPNIRLKNLFRSHRGFGINCTGYEYNVLHEHFADIYKVQQSVGSLWVIPAHVFDRHRLHTVRPGSNFIHWVWTGTQKHSEKQTCKTTTVHTWVSLQCTCDTARFLACGHLCINNRTNPKNRKLDLQQEHEKRQWW